MIPRDYQRAAVAAAREKTACEGNTLLMLATGGGKTARFYIGEEAADDPASRFLVVQHIDELIERNCRTIGRITRLPSSIVKAERDDRSGRWCSAASDPGPRQRQAAATAAARRIFDGVARLRPLQICRQLPLELPLAPRRHPLRRVRCRPEGAA